MLPFQLLQKFIRGCRGAAARPPVVRLGLETELSVTQPILRWGLWDRLSESPGGTGASSGWLHGLKGLVD